MYFAERRFRGGRPKSNGLPRAHLGPHADAHRYARADREPSNDLGLLRDFFSRHTLHKGVCFGVLPEAAVKKIGVRVHGGGSASLFSPKP